MIGVIEGEQGKKKQKENDRIVAIEQANHSFADINHIRDLGGKFVRELGEVLRQLSRAYGQEVSNSRCEGSDQSSTSH